MSLAERLRSLQEKGVAATSSLSPTTTTTSSSSSSSTSSTASRNRSSSANSGDALQTVTAGDGASLRRALAAEKQQQQKQQQSSSVTGGKSATGGKTAFVLWAFVGSNPGEITVSEGAQVRVVAETNSEWWKVETLDKKHCGFIPANYLELVAAESSTSLSSSSGRDGESDSSSLSPSSSLSTKKGSRTRPASSMAASSARKDKDKSKKSKERTRFGRMFGLKKSSSKSANSDDLVLSSPVMVKSTSERAVNPQNEGEQGADSVMEPTNLLEVVRQDQWRACLLRFLATETPRSDQTVLLWDALAGYRAADSPMARAQHAAAVLANYLEPDAPHHVPLFGINVDFLKKAALSDPQPGTFDVAFAAVETALTGLDAQPQFERFRESPLFQKCLDQLRQDAEDAMRAAQQVFNQDGKPVEDFENALQRLAKNDRTLVKLALPHSQMPPSQLDQLAAALELNHVLEKLRLSDRAFRSPDLNINIIIKSLHSHETIQILDLSRNACSVIPDCIGDLCQLKELILQENSLVFLPSTISKLTNLEVLDISQNKFTAVPPQLHLLTSLTTFNAPGNRITSLPVFLSSMPALISLQLDRNPLKSIPREILQRGDSDLLVYLREHASGSRDVYRMKLMFVGQGNVGKTSLLNALQQGRKKKGLRQLLKGDDTKKRNVATDGIDISEWNLKSPLLPSPDDSLTFSAWDFAGQEVYYSTHQFFMSHRAIYLVVFNLVDLGESRIEYWLQSVQARGRGAPVILVGTHFDDKRCTDEYMSDTYAYLKRKYLNRHPNIVTLLSVSTRTGRCVDEVRDEVIQTALKLDYMPEEIPLRYLDVEEKLLSLRSVLPVPTLSWEAFAQMCEGSHVQSESLASLATYLNDLGVLVYFRDVNRDVVVIDPQWITQMFATIVSMKANFAKGGLLKKSTLPQMWRAPRHPPELHAYMLKLLKKFEVVFELNEEDLFIPCLLNNSPKQEVLDAEWAKALSVPADKELCFARCYKFQFVPLGFMSRLIVRFLNTFDWSPSYYWQHGIILVKPEHRLRVALDPNTHELVLFVRGPDAGKHLLPLLESIDTFVEDWLQVQVQVSVPCTRSLDGPLSEPYPRFPLKEIETSVANGNLYLRVKMPDGEELHISVTENAPDISLEDVQVPKIDFAALTLAEECGEGGYATVYHGRWNGMEVAVKKLTVNSEEDEPSKALEVFAEFRKEVAVMGHLNHRSLVRLLGVVMEPLCMVLEYMNAGSLYDFLHSPEKVPNAPVALDWATRLGVACDIASGMHFLHSAQMIHRDLKSPNVLLHGELLPDGTYYLVAKVADFGLSRNTVLSTTLKAKVVDNPTWLAPEIMGKKSYTHKSDVYSFGVILYELLTRRSYFHDVEWDWKIEEMVIKGQRPPLPELGPEDKDFADFWELIRESWDPNPEKRPEFGEMRKRLRLMHAPFAATLKETLTKAALSRRAWVLWDFDSLSESEISAKQGDLVDILDWSGQEWVSVSCRATGQVGYIPAGYLQEVDMADHELITSSTDLQRASVIADAALSVVQKKQQQGESADIPAAAAVDNSSA